MRPMRVKRLHVHRPIPPRAHDLRQAFGVVLIRLVHLHLERGTGVPRLQANNVELSATQFMHKPRRHRPGLDTDPGAVSRMLPDDPRDLLGVGGVLPTPEPASCVVNDADRRQLL